MHRAEGACAFANTGEAVWRAMRGFNCSCHLLREKNKDVSGRGDRLDRVGNGGSD